MPVSEYVTIRCDFLPKLDAGQRALLDITMEAQRNAAANNTNMSKVAAVQAWQGSGSYVQAVCAGLLTTGLRHAPLQAARKTFRSSPLQIEVDAANDRIIPGFGNSFFKDRIDPSLQPVMDELMKFPGGRKITELRDAMWRANRKVWPNAALLTAAVCDTIECPEGVEEFFFLTARLPVWTAAMLT